MIVVLVLHIIESVAIRFKGFLAPRKLVVRRLLVEAFIGLISSSLVVDLQGQKFLHIVYQRFGLLRIGRFV